MITFFCYIYCRETVYQRKIMSSSSYIIYSYLQYTTTMIAFSKRELISIIHLFATMSTHVPLHRPIYRWSMYIFNIYILHAHTRPCYLWILPYLLQSIMLLILNHIAHCVHWHNISRANNTSMFLSIKLKNNFSLCYFQFSCRLVFNSRCCLIL